MKNSFTLNNIDPFIPSEEDLDDSPLHYEDTDWLYEDDILYLDEGSCVYPDDDED